MKKPKVLVIYKKSAYEIYVLKYRSHHFMTKAHFGEAILMKLMAYHAIHYRALDEVKTVLKERKINYRVVHRALDFKPLRYDLIVSIGGDGTFLESARKCKGQVLLGVNSNPIRSIGHLCVADQFSFERIFERYCKGKVEIKKIYPLELKLEGKLLKERAFNDCLICDSNPAAMSQYWIQIGKAKEEQRGSGIWISAATGSTGAIQSAGGKVLPISSRQIQYMPRELYRAQESHYQLLGDVLGRGKKITIGCLMRAGHVYLDGEHMSFPFSYGEELELSSSSAFLQMVTSP